MSLTLLHPSTRCPSAPPSLDPSIPPRLVPPPAAPPLLFSPLRVPPRLHPLTHPSLRASVPDRFARTNDGFTARQITVNKQIRALFDAGVDYWQRKRHGHHSWSMREIVQALLIVELRLNRKLAARKSPRRSYLVNLPEEIWLVVLAFMRSADFDGM